MKSEYKIAVIGGDMRLLVAARSMWRDGLKTAVYGFDKYKESTDESIIENSLSRALADADVIILPLPVSFDGLRVNAPFCSEDIRIESIVDNAKRGALILGGKLCDKVYECTLGRGLEIIDYFEREELIIQNSIPSAEGAIAIALNELPITLFSSKSLVLGFGRLGKILAKDLLALGSRVTVAARKNSDFAWIDALGYSHCNIYSPEVALSEADVIFNTVPFVILDEEKLKTVSKNALIIDLASRPGGVDSEAAKRLGIRVVWALSLPGKVAPVSAGYIIKDTCCNILRERGIIK